MKNNKAPRDNGISVEMDKLSPTLLCQLKDLLVEVWATKKLPKYLKLSVLSPVYKKGCKAICSNYRGTSLIDHVMKVFCIIILNHFKDALDMLTRPEQVGFGPRGGCQKHCLTLHLILQQSERFQLSDMIAFIDFVPAFDSLIRTELVKIVLEDGAPAGLIEIFKGAYESTVTKVRATEGEITEFYVDSGFKQWCALLPARFNYIKDCILAYRLCNHKGLVIGQRRDTLIDFDFDDLK